MRSDLMEPFDDQNDNRIRDDWEEYKDLNDNGQYDVGPRLKLTVAPLLPALGPHSEQGVRRGRQDPRSRLGVVPDVEVEMSEYRPEEAWKTRPLRDLLKKGVFRQYVKDHMEEHQDLLLELSYGDGGVTTRYPDFDEFYAELDTKLPRDDIRKWIRYMVRDAVADVRGKAFAGARAMGDPQEDAQLQEALRNVLDKLGRDIAEVEEYRDVLKIAKAEGTAKDERPR